MFNKSCVRYTHEQNGTTERNIQNIVDIGLALWGHCRSPLKYWHFAFETTIFVINWLPSTSLAKSSPFQVLFNQLPNYSFLKVSACVVYPLLHTIKINFLFVLWNMFFRSFTHSFWVLLLGYKVRKNHNCKTCWVWWKVQSI